MTDPKLKEGIATATFTAADWEKKEAYLWKDDKQHPGFGSPDVLSTNVTKEGDKEGFTLTWTGEKDKCTKQDKTLGTWTVAIKYNCVPKSVNA